MEKISKIIPPSARTVSADLKNSGTARSGAPSFGREQGVSAAAQRMQGDTFTRASTQHKDIMAERVQDPKARIIAKMADSFFMKNGRPNEEVAPVTADQYLAPDFDADLDPSTVNVDADADEKPWVASLKAERPERSDEAEDLDKPEVGGNLDVVV